MSAGKPAAWIPGKQRLVVGGELLANDAIEFLESYAAVGVAHGPICGEAHEVRVRHVDWRLEILLNQVRHRYSLQQQWVETNGKPGTWQERYFLQQ